MKVLLLIVVVSTFCIVSSQPNSCNSQLQKYTGCVTDAFQAGTCNAQSYCKICTTDYVDYANCTCDRADAPSGKTNCDSLCVNFSLCKLMQVFNATLNCDSAQQAYIQCFTQPLKAKTAALKAVQTIEKNIAVLHKRMNP